MTDTRPNSPEQAPSSFNPNEHVIQLKSKQGSQDYLPVQWRLVWFRTRFPHGSIKTEERVVDLDREVEEEAYVWNNEKRRSEKVVKRAKGYARFKAYVDDGNGGHAEGTKSETAASFPDYAEKAETGAMGRALAGLGYGTQFAPEFNEAHRLVDSPVDRQGRDQTVAPTTELAPMESAPTRGESRHDEGQDTTTMTAMMTDEQRKHIEKLLGAMEGQSLPDHLEPLTFIAAKMFIQELTAQYRDYRSTKKNQPNQPQPSSQPTTHEAVSDSSPQAIEKELQTLCAGLKKPALAALRTYRQKAAPPLAQPVKQWTPHQWQQALDLTRTWLTTEVTPDNVESLNALRASVNRAVLQSLSQRIIGKPIADLKHGPLECFLALVQEQMLLIDLAAQVDKAGEKVYAHLQSAFQVKHPLDLVGTEDTQALATYTAYVRDQMLVAGKEPTEALKHRYGTRYEAFLKEPEVAV